MSHKKGPHKFFIDLIVSDYAEQETDISWATIPNTKAQRTPKVKIRWKRD